MAWRRTGSFGAKLTILVTVTTGVAVLSVCTILAIADYLDTKRETIVLAVAQTNIIAVNSEAPLMFGDPKLGAEALAALKSSSHVASASLFTPAGRLFARYLNPAITVPEFAAAEPGRMRSDRWLIVTDRVTGPAGDVGRLQVVFDMAATRARAWGNARLVGIVAVLTVLVSFLVAMRIRRFLVRPIAELADTARRVSETKDYSIRAGTYGSDELGRFSDVFNEMLAQIQKQDLEIQESHAQREEILEAERVARVEVERASRMKDEFVATLSHELRTPLSAILGWAQMLRSGTCDSDEVAKGMEVIERNARMQTQIIEDLLDMSRIVSGKIRLDVQHVDLVDVIEAALTTVRPAADAKGIRLQTLLDPGIGAARGDPNRLQQIVWNLLSNAIKFTDRNGRVQISLGRAGSHVEIVVGDSGQGIDPEFLPHVFDRFRQADSSTTRRFTGLGLGLAIVKQLVELHGGTVHAKSAGEGKGATFIVDLPLVSVHEATRADRVHPRASQSRESPPTGVSLTGLKVLVVDDDPDARDLIGRVLASHGADVASASSAVEALACFEEQRPDVLISDIGMPHQDGYELIKNIRALEASSHVSVPAVALTAFARSEDRTRAMLAGYQMHLAKPVEPAELIATVASVAGRTIPVSP